MGIYLFYLPHGTSSILPFSVSDTYLYILLAQLADQLCELKGKHACRRARGKNQKGRRRRFKRFAKMLRLYFTLTHVTFCTLLNIPFGSGSAGCAISLTRRH